MQTLSFYYWRIMHKLMDGFIHLFTFTHYYYLIHRSKRRDFLLSHTRADIASAHSSLPVTHHVAPHHVPSKGLGSSFLCPERREKLDVSEY